MFRDRFTAPALTGVLWVTIAAADDAPDSVAWRDFDAAAFAEAAATERPVFLFLTAPWNWDHFLVPRGVLADPDIVEVLNDSFVPIRADASVRPELRRLYSITTGLLPSIHFLDANGEVRGSFPPLGAEELAYYLEEMAEPRSAVDAGEPEKTIAVEAERFANVAARRLIQRLVDEDYRAGEAHLDYDPSTLSFLLEFNFARPQRKDPVQATRGAIVELGNGPLFDSRDGGFHRAIADADLGIAHYEKLLRPNAELGQVLATWFRLAGEEGAGAGALMTIKFLNDRLRTGGTTLYAGSLAADVWNADRTQLLVKGHDYYGLPAPARRTLGDPPRSEDVPVGANFALHTALLEYWRVFRDARMRSAVGRGGALLLENGFEPDGTARRSLGRPGPGNLRDQGDAGSGLLAYHSMTGDPEGLARAVEVARSLRERYWDAERGLFRNVARDAGDPAHLIDAPPDPAWNGTVLRFLGELAAATGDDVWRDLVEESIAAWAERVPESLYGLADLGRAALRLEPVPVIVLDVTPGTPAADELADIAHQLFDRLVVVRWLDPAHREHQAHDLGIESLGEPALYLVWDGVSAPTNSARGLAEEFEQARERVRGLAVEARTVPPDSY